MEKFKITITEVCKQTVEVEAESYEAAKEQVENDYWKDPNAYILEPEDTFFE